jgi:hypothetical protein
MMNSAGRGAPGSTRICPHCKATVLMSANICPGCQHHLRFNAAGAESQAEGISALKIEGTIQRPPSEGQCEYCVVVSITNERGEKVARQVVGVGALNPGERHSYSFSVDLLPTRPVPPAPPVRPPPATRPPQAPKRS